MYRWLTGENPLTRTLSMRVSTVMLLMAAIIGSSEQLWSVALACIKGIDHRFWSMGLAAACVQLSAFCTVVLLGQLRPDGRYRQAAHWAAALVIAAGFYLVAERRPFGNPYWDDYYALLRWFSDWQDAEDVRSRLAVLAGPYWECKTAVSRTVSVLMETLFHDKFLHLQKYLNGLLLMAIAWLLSIHFDETKKRRTVFISSIILFFNFQNFHNTLCAFSGTTYYLTALFALTAFSAAGWNHRIAPWISAACATLAGWTFGNGWLVFPILLADAFFRRNRRNMYILLPAMTLAVCGYFMDYHPERLNDIDSFSLQSMIAYTGIFLGNSMQFLYSKLLPATAAICILAITLWRSVNLLSGNRKASSLLCMSWFLVGTALMAAVFRHQAGTMQAFSVRYGFFSLISLWCTVLLFLEHSQPNVLSARSRLIIVSAAALTLFKTIFFYPEMAIAQEEQREMLTEWKRYDKEVHEHTPFYPKGVGEIMTESEKNGTWCMSTKDTVIPHNRLFTIRYVYPANRWRNP